MDIITYSKLKKCISIDINAGHSFASNTDRDTFFTNNPTQLKANMYIYCNGQLQQYINSAWEVRSAAIQGSKGDKGDAGIDGTNGISPHIDETTNNWFIGTTDTGIKAIGIDGTNGTNGVSPHIGVNGNWYIGETDTLVKAQGIDGTNGINGTNGVDGVGIQSVVDNGNNTFTITLTNGTPTIIDKIDTISSDIVTQGEINLYITPTQVNKLTNIEENAEVNNISDINATDLTDNGDTTLHYHSSDRDRTNHTGTQAIATVNGLQTALDNKANKDFTLYTQKADVVNDDKVIINDSADSNSIKYVTLNQLISSVQDPHNKGYYDTGTALNTALPTANDGDFAVVGATETVWVWSSASNAFVDSGANGAVTSINGRTGVITLTKADVGLNNVVNLDTSTTANITDSSDKRFVTDANLVVLGNTSGTNTGDETQSSIITKIGYTPENISNKDTDGTLGSNSDIKYPSQKAVKTYADTKLTKSLADDYYEPKDSSIQTHIVSTANPHSVTKEQVGLENCDNTSDVDKPISTATQTALNSKLEVTNLIAGANIILDKAGNNVTINASGGTSEIPAPTETTFGGIKAKARTTEDNEVVVDETTGKAYVGDSGGGFVVQAELDKLCAVCGYDLTTLRDQPQSLNFYMQKAYFPPNLISVGSYALYASKCYEVYGGEKLTTIGTAFCQSNISLTTVNLPSVETVGASFCAGCNTLTSVSLPSLITTPASGFLNGCISLTSIDLPLLTTLDKGFCQNCNSLITVNLPSLTTITQNGYFLYNCNSLTNLSFGGRSNVITLTYTGAWITTIKSPNLTVESLVALGNALTVWTPTTATATFTFHTTAWNRLSTAQKAIFTSKGYTIATAT